MIQAAVLLGYLLAAGLFLWGSPLHPLIVIMAIKFYIINAVLIILFNAAKILIAPYPRAWELFLRAQHLAAMNRNQQQPVCSKTMASPMCRILRIVISIPIPPASILALPRFSLIRRGQVAYKHT